MSARELVLGTAGHIDHGKTTLVRALTGTDTDRLPEERRRGITIELGFARWQLDAGKGQRLAVSIVDVPGHEALVRTMVAGAGGMDAVLLVISAEDGVMPQTREHLRVCALLGLRHAVVALTKIDRLGEDPSEREELLELAREDVRAELEATSFADAPIIPVSATEGAGLDELRAAVVGMIRGLPGRERKGPPILPVDRVFTMRGHGTVITGTLLCGELELREGSTELTLVPQGLGRQPFSVRVRGMQVHGEEATRSRAGTRTALNLGKVGVEALERGDVLTSGLAVVASDRLLARVEQLDFGARPWTRGTSLQLCAGTASTAAHLVPLTLADPETGALLDPVGKIAIGPGQAGLARLYLDVPLPIWAGQRLILRAFSAAHMQTDGLTIGGGVVVDPLPERRQPARRVALARALLGDDASAKVRALVEDAGASGVTLEALTLRAGVIHAAKLLGRMGVESGPLIELGGRWFARALLEPLLRAAVTEVDRFHAAHPLQPGLARATLEGALAQAGPSAAALRTAAVDLALARAQLRVADRSGSLARPGKGTLDPNDLPPPLHDVVERYRHAGISPPTLRDLGEALGLDAKAVLERVGVLQRSELLIKINDDLSYAPEAHAQLLTAVREHLAAHGELDVQALKGMTGLSRKFAVPWMEHLDRLGVTRRAGDRRLPGPKA
ncbi:selenocysteine-specific translation elongation factor [Pseudenhygromyxa sp. WMMC2535]|uniref:selenocysteine-specific translation elongation factor n=1 Tax=Pseudenhygromyxa sp. WMMC2535 TaxID=2712867 RepID=UPI00155708F5|nr:selenocysteine-specific translation elongation factor [Pseudenhygromyxa sp. WMMC2535]